MTSSFYFNQKHYFPFTLITWQYVPVLSDQIFTLCEKNLLIKYNHNDVLVSHVVALIFALQFETASDVDEQSLVLCCNRGSQLWVEKLFVCPFWSGISQWFSLYLMWSASKRLTKTTWNQLSCIFSLFSREREREKIFPSHILQLWPLNL